MTGDARNPSFSPEAMKEFEAICSRYPNRMAPLLMVLHLAEKEFGWLSEEAQSYVASLLDLPASHVSGVVTFYTMYKRVPKGEHRIQFCSTLSCALRGSEEVFDHACKRLGLGPKGGVTEDGKVSIEKVECLGACDWAPMMLENDITHKYLTTQAMDDLSPNGVSKLWRVLMPEVRWLMEHADREEARSLKEYGDYGALKKALSGKTR